MNNGMDVIALVGPPGTGKSHRAMLVARDHGTSCVIDDGLFIHGSKVIAGRSAKHEPTRMQAVHRAIFSDDAHVSDVKAGIERTRPERILVLGTSGKMIQKICERLGLPSPIRTLQIDEVSNPADMRVAQRARNKEGKHVIPAPTFEVKRGFRSGVVLPLKLFYKDQKSKKPVVVNKSVVRPTYTNLGHFFMTESALRDLLQHLLRQHPEIFAVHRPRVEVREERVRLAADLTLYPEGSLVETLRKVQRDVGSRMQELTAVQIDALDLTVTSLVVEAWNSKHAIMTLP